MEQLNPQSNTDNRVFEFVKYVLSEVLSKITTVTTSINEVSNQVKTQTLLSTQPPTRADIIDKIDGIANDLSKEIDASVVASMKDNHKVIQHQIDDLEKKLDDKEKDHSNFKKTTEDLTKQIEILIIQTNQISSIVNKLNTKVIIFLQLIAGLVALIPILWGLFGILSKIPRS